VKFHCLEESKAPETTPSGFQARTYEPVFWAGQTAKNRPVLTTKKYEYGCFFPYHRLYRFFMITLIMIVHIIVSLALIFIVLLQTGRGAGIGAAFGGSSQTVFGSSGATPFLAKLTAAAAILFMVTSLALSILGHRGGASVMEGAAPAQQTAPAEKPAAPAPAAPAK
jgi:preprotein translocase subunit SecG